MSCLVHEVYLNSVVMCVSELNRVGRMFGIEY
jgi:hypothetical protein